ncbi:MAG: transcriptional repressor LexA [Oscillospiraceae bacterium]|nr:transcriptional repressor LexA [Oscillospiraceae bacterium]
MTGTNQSNQLNFKERAVYEFIIGTIKKDGFSPSVRDIKIALNIKSTATVHSYLEKLEKKGYIEKEAGKSRTIRVDNIDLQGKRTSIKVPIIGKVTAGVPILAAENREGFLDFPIYRQSYLSAKLFALKIRGDSMIEAGIMDGDYVVVEKKSYADNGEIVVALIDEEATVKKYYFEEDAVRLQPCNSAMRPIFVKDVAVLGIVISVMRFY